MSTMVETRNDEIIRTLYTEVASGSITGKNRDGTAGEYAATDNYAMPASLKAFYKFFAEVGRAFPDYELKIDNLAEKGNKIMVRYIIRGTHKSRFMGMAPTNNKTDIRGIDIFRLEHGKITYYWNSAYQLDTLVGC